MIKIELKRSPPLIRYAATEIKHSAIAKIDKPEVFRIGSIHAIRIISLLIIPFKGEYFVFDDSMMLTTSEKPLSSLAIKFIDKELNIRFMIPSTCVHYCSDVHNLIDYLNGRVYVTRKFHKMLCDGQ